jgi:hypothetical protein
LYDAHPYEFKFPRLTSCLTILDEDNFLVNLLTCGVISFVAMAKIKNHKSTQ